jgi:hypothetical protein
MKILAALAILASFTTAQSPPSPYFYVGGLNHLQANSSNWGFPGVAGEQMVSALADPADVYNIGLGLPEIKIGGRLWWNTVSNHPTTSPVTFSTTGTTAVVFGVAAIHWGSFTFPGAASGFDGVFLDPNTMVTVSPFLRSTHQSTMYVYGAPGAAYPSGGTDIDWLYWDVPNQTSLAGSTVSMQALRLDGTNGLWYLSDEHATTIHL